MSLALGVTIVAYRGSNADLMHVLFGTVLAIDIRALLLIAVVSSISILVLAVIYRPLAVETIDPAFLRTIGGGRLAPGIFLLLVVVNLVITPHTSATSQLTTDLHWSILSENLGRFQRGETLMNLVDKGRGW